MANDFTDPSGSVGRELSALRKELEALKRTSAAQAANSERTAKAVERGAPSSSSGSKRSDERSVKGAQTRKETQQATATDSAAARAAQQRARVTQDLEGRQRRLAAAERELGGTLRTQIQQGNLASQELRRRGALTTEAIQAAANGTITMRELGYQVGATIGKFAGWTLAAGFTFAAIDAVHQLGTGALEGAEGVNKLTRVINNVDTSRAHDQIRRLAESANTDLATVGEGLFESGKVFQNQGDAEKLTRVALRAKNIGELEVGDAVKFLTSIVRGFKLEASDASSVLDIFNNLQQKFGTDIRGGLQGAAQGSAQFLNAGGNLRQFAALIATIQRSGFSGSEAGVALRRSSELIKRPGGINRERLAAFGIDSKDPLDKIYEQAISLAESGKVKGPRINELATALVTPQLSPRIASILNRPDQFRRAFQIAGPTSKDSAVKEEKKFLSAPIQQLRAIGVELQKLGDALGEAGAFTGILVMAKGLDLALESATQLVNAFNELPGPIRQAVVVAGELYAVTRLIRRFNPGDGVTPGRFGGFFQPSPNARIKKFLRNDVGGEVQFYRNEQERLANTQRSATLRAQGATANAGSVYASNIGAAKAGDTAAQRAIIEADEDAIRTTKAAERAKVEYVNANRGLTSALRTQTLVDRRLRNPVNTPLGVARSVGYSTISPSLNTPTDLQPGTVTPGGLLIPGGVSKPQRIEGQSKEAVQRAVKARQELRRVATSGTAFQRAMGLFGLGVAGVGAGIKGIPNVASRASTGLASVGTRLGLAAASIGALLGPLEIGFLALIGITEALNAASETASLADQIKASRTKKLSVAEARLQLQQAKDTGGGIGGALNDAFDKTKNLFDFNSGNDGLAFTSDRQRNVDDAENIYLAAKRRAEKNREREARLREAQAKARFSNAPNRYNPKVFDDGQLQEEIDALSTLGGLGRLGNKGISDLTAAYIEAINRFAGSRDPDDIQKLASAQQAFETALGGIQQNLERELELAGNDPTARRSAYQEAKSKALRVRAQARRNLERARSQFRQARQEETNTASTERRFNQEQASPLVGGNLGLLPNRVEQTANKKRAEAKKKLSAAEKALKAVNEFLRTFLHDLAKAFNQSAEDQFSKFDEQTDRIRQRGEVAASGTLNTGSQLASRLESANQNLSRARGLGDGPEAERRINDAIIERNNILNEMANLAVSRLEAASQITIASAPTEVGRIRAEIGAAQAKLALLRSQGRGSEETDVVVADIIRLQKDLQRQILEDARALADAVAEYRKSLTANPNREAKIDLALARRQLQLARQIDDPNERRVEVLKARARVNEAKGSSVLTRYQEKGDTAEYKARIGLISTDQEYRIIQGLIESVTKKQIRTIDGMRDLVRGWKERLKQLSDESNLEINPSSIRLPTLYDVRRIQRQGTNQAASGVIQQQNSYTFHTSSVGEAEALGGVLDNIQGTHTTAAMRAAGLI